MFYLHFSTPADRAGLWEHRLSTMAFSPDHQVSIVGSLCDIEVAVADPECATGGGVSHILAEKRDFSFTSLKKMHENSIFSPIMGGGGAFAGYALCWIRHWVACSASDRQGSNFESCVSRAVSSQSSHHPQEVLLAQFSLYVHKGGLKPDSFNFPDHQAQHSHGSRPLCGVLRYHRPDWQLWGHCKSAHIFWGFVVLWFNGFSVHC